MVSLLFGLSLQLCNYILNLKEKAVTRLYFAIEAVERAS